METSHMNVLVHIVALVYATSLCVQTTKEEMVPNRHGRQFLLDNYGGRHTSNQVIHDQIVKASVIPYLRYRLLVEGSNLK